jgi:hypothetical protein
MPEYAKRQALRPLDNSRAAGAYPSSYDQYPADSYQAAIVKSNYEARNLHETIGVHPMAKMRPWQQKWYDESQAKAAAAQQKLATATSAQQVETDAADPENMPVMDQATTVASVAPVTSPQNDPTVDPSKLKEEADAALVRAKLRNNIAFAAEKGISHDDAYLLMKMYAASFKMQDNIARMERQGEQLIKEGDIYTGQQMIYEAQRHRSVFADVMDLLINAEKMGLTKAIRNLEHYLTGTGTTMFYSYAEIKEASGFDTANLRLNGHFQNWIFEQVDLVGPGETKKVDTDFSAMENGSFFSDSFYAFGTFSITGMGVFDIVKDQQGHATVSGKIYKTFYDQADWNKGQSTPYTFAWVSDDEMGELSRVGGQAFAVRGFYETNVLPVGNSSNKQGYFLFQDVGTNTKTPFHRDQDL